MNYDIIPMTSDHLDQVAELEKRGYHIIPESVKYKGDRMTLAYLEGDFGGFAVHLVQK